ncbi:MAG: hypothetical protein BRD36_00300 [Bacteroidetes bacterium QH_7_64_110]|nr:MAG: hypothetical protein BRD36_00300 [Bacteroidetes bacterium QH_7_64_110]
MVASERDAPLQFVVDVVHNRLNPTTDSGDGRLQRIDVGRLLLEIRLDRFGLFEKIVQVRELFLVAFELDLSEKLDDCVGEAEARIEKLIPRQVEVARGRF